MPAEAGPAASRVDGRRFARLRWVNLGLALGTVVLMVAGFSVALPLSQVAGLLGFAALTNAALHLVAGRRSPVAEWVVGALLLLDIAVFTALLHLTGGSYNPFSLLYLLYVVVAAVSLRPRWIALATVATVAGFGLLFALERPPADAHAGHGQHSDHSDHGGHHGHTSDSGAMGLHLYGMWLASGIAAVFTGAFVYGQRQTLAARDAELHAERARLERAERLASLATLAAGAAHELSTPLSTIAVVASELVDTLTAPEQAEAREDAALIRAQVQRCHVVLEQLSVDAGAHAGEAPVPLSAAEVVRHALRPLRDADRVSVRVADGLPTLSLPVRVVARALRSLVDNALRADLSGHPELRVAPADGGWSLSVLDRGPGMDAETRRRALEPFFTTRAVGEGMGLGLYLAHEVAQRLGGALTLDAREGGGTVATLTVAGPGAVAAGAAAGHRTTGASASVVAASTQRPSAGQEQR